MCKVHKPVGCLTTIKTHLKRYNINEFNSLNEVISFQRSFPALRHQIISDHELLIEKEKANLSEEILQLDNIIKTDKIHFESYFLSEIEEVKQKLNSLSVSTGFNFIKRLVNYTKHRSYTKKLQNLEANLNENVNYAIRDLVGQQHDKTNRYIYINTYFSNAVNESSLRMIKELECKQRVIDEVKNSIYGALGEHKVVKELENLSDENVLINDFTLSFHPAIYNRQENDYIKSIQIDHLLVTPSGLFLIETKNWSEESLKNLDLRSPVQQVKRTNFALFKTITDNISSGRLRLQQHHWGDKKIPIRNLIVLTNSKPEDEFQFVKVLKVSELLNYIGYFKPIFTSAETQTIANYLLNLCD
jgi:hypothetical protein